MGSITRARRNEGLLFTAEDDKVSDFDVRGSCDELFEKA
jgi:hypothetical protein